MLYSEVSSSEVCGILILETNRGNSCFRKETCVGHRSWLPILQLVGIKLQSVREILS